MKKNKQMKSIHKELIQLLEEQGFTYDKETSRVTLEKELQNTPIQISVPFQLDTSVEKAIQSIRSKIECKSYELELLIKELYEKYTDLTSDILITCYNTLSNPCSKINRIKKELKQKIDNELLIREIEQYEHITDYPQIFPKARARKRKIIAYLGDTNSGKTYNALSEIANSFSSAYLAPLRLLALENYETLNNQGIPTSLITGEEKIIKNDAWCTSSTVECFNSEIEYESVVIDEIQMIDDKDRGAFFVQALVGANADKVIVTGPLEYEERLRFIADYLGEEIEVKKFTRKSGLTTIKPMSLNEVKKNTAIVTFSRRNVFAIRDALPKHIKSSVIYGALGYDVRKKQAEQFATGQTDVVITTDAIGMGLNLPIETVLFTTHEKYDGETFGELSQMLTKQIAGRAGRFGIFDQGYVTATNKDTLDYVVQCMSKPLEVDATAPLSVIPTNDYIETMMEKYNVSTILSNWSRLNYPKGSIFINNNLDEQAKVAGYLEKIYPLACKKFYQLIYCPIDYEKDLIVFRELVENIISRNLVKKPNVSEHAPVSNLEESLRRLTITLWFAHHYKEQCETGYDDFITYTNNCVETISKVLHKKLTVGKMKRKLK